MKIDFMTPKQASELWGITERHVQSLCLKGKIKGAVMLGRAWLIPKNAERPIDGRTKAANNNE